MTRFLAVFVAFVFVALPALADGADALFDAAREGTADDVKAAIAAGADANAREEHGSTPLHAAAGINPNPAVVAALLAGGADAAARDLSGRTPLHKAIWNDEPAVIEALIDAGANPNARDKGGDTPLHLAAWGARPVAVKTLLAAGADPDTRSRDGHTPLHYEVTSTLTETAEANLSVIEALLAADADVNARDERGRTPLHEMLSSAQLFDEMLRDEDWKPAEEATRRRFAAFINRTPSAIEALLDAGADPALRDEDGKVPFDYAKDNEALKGTEAYWRLNDGRFE